MSAKERKITPNDILPYADYAAQRSERRKALMARKKDRRVEVGPFATFYFENYDTMWQQVHEMLHIEKGGDEQAAGEMEVYNPLIPQGSELIATLMLEIEDETRREAQLKKLGGIEESISLHLGGETIKATPTDYDERTTPDGKTSSVHWLRFVFTPDQIAAFRNPNVKVSIEVGHENYGHTAVIAPDKRAEISKDFA